MDVRERERMPKTQGVAAPWRRAIWLAYVVAWTAALIFPTPETGDWTVEGLGLDLKFLFAKSVHVAAYAVLTVLTGWQRAPMRSRWLLLFFLMVHGTATELIQQLPFSHRTGSLNDVAFDHLGVALGALVSWRWWSKP